jgi:predicted ATPase
MSNHISLISSKDCHGRETEKKALHEYFEKCRYEGIYVTVQGRSGCGKTVLLASRPWDRRSEDGELDPTARSASFFLSARFDQVQSSQANFSAISQGVNELCEEWAKSPKGLTQIQTFCKDESHDEESIRHYLPSLYKLSMSTATGDSTTSVVSFASTSSSRSIGSLGSRGSSFKEPIDHRRSFERFRTLIYKLLRFMIEVQSKEIVFLFHDIQWADAKSLELLGFLIEENVAGLLMISTYGNEELQEDPDSSRVFTEHLNSLRLSDQSEDRVFSLSLQNFTLDEVNGVFSNLVERPLEETLPLVKVIQEKTGGNPFFVVQFIRLLERQGLLVFSFNSCRWEWKDASEVRQATAIVSSEVAEMVASSMRKLHPRVQEVLKVASCLGSRFPLVLLKEYFRLNNVSVNVDDALKELGHLDVIQKGGKNGDSADFHSFSHEKLQKAAVSLFDDAYDRDEMRLELGKLLLNIISAQSASRSSTNDLLGLKRDYLIYLAADQLNRVPTVLLFEAGENMRVDLAKLNLQAARLSISKSAFFPAIDLLNAGIGILKATGKNRSLLKPAKSVEVARTSANGRAAMMMASSGSSLMVSPPTRAKPGISANSRASMMASMGSLPPPSPRMRAKPILTAKFANSVSAPPDSFSMLDVSDRYKEMDMWADHYALSLELYSNLSEMEYTVGHQEKAQGAIDQVLEKAKTQEDKFRAQACMLEITANGKARDFKSGVRMCVEILKTYGVNLPMNPNKLQVGMEKRKLQKAFPNGRLQDLVHMSTMKDKRAICISLFLGKLAFFSAMAMEPNFTKLVALRSFSISATHGINTYTALAMASYGFAFRKESDHGVAFTYGELAYELLKRVTSKPGPNYARILCMVQCSTIPLRRPFPDLLEPFMDVYKIGIKTGDVEFAFTGAMCYGYIYIMVGLPLAPLEADMEAYGQESRQFGVTPSVQVQFPIFLQTILNLRHEPQNPTELSGSAMNESDILDQVEGNGCSMTLRDILIFRLMLSFVFRDVDSGLTVVEELSKYPVFNPNLARSYMRQIFTGLVAFMLYRKTGVRKYLKLGQSALDFFQEAVKNSSINAYPMLSLLQAEKTPSKEGYDNAIRVCARSGLPNFAGMANESAARYFLDTSADKGGDEEDGNYYMSRAISLYNDWGASAKVALLKQDFPHCFETYRQSINSGLTLRSSHVSRSHHDEGCTGETMNLSFTGKDMGAQSEGGRSSNVSDHDDLLDSTSESSWTEI